MNVANRDYEHPGISKSTFAAEVSAPMFQLSSATDKVEPGQWSKLGSLLSTAKSVATMHDPHFKMSTALSSRGPVEQPAK